MQKKSYQQLSTNLHFRRNAIWFYSHLTDSRKKISSKNAHNINIYNIIILYYGLNRQATNMCEFVVGVNTPKIGFELHALSISKLQKK